MADPIQIQTEPGIKIDICFAPASKALLDKYTTTAVLQATYATKDEIHPEASPLTGDQALVFEGQALVYMEDEINLTTEQREQVVKLTGAAIICKLDSTMPRQVVYVTNSSDDKIDLGRAITAEDPSIAILGDKTNIEQGATATVIFSTTTTGDPFDPTELKRYVQFLNTI